MRDPKTFKVAVDDLVDAITDALYLPQIVAWLDRRLRGFPRLYSWLSRP